VNSYRAHGLTISSERPLPGLPPYAGSAVDSTGLESPLQIAFEAVASLATERPPGTVLAEFGTTSTSGYCVARDDQGYLARFYGTCDVRIASTLDAAVVALPPGDSGLAQVVTAGSVLATVLMLRGSTVLHAAAVRLDETATVIVGHSGAGKSTVAALLCAAGGRLFSDDVLRIAATPQGFHAARGSDRLRLRPGAAVLTEWFPASAVSTSVDGRSILAPDCSDEAVLGLGRLVLPIPDHEGEEVRAEPVPAADALPRLMAAPRLPGWHEPVSTLRWFSDCGRLVSQLPVIELRVPWGPPFAAELPARMLAALAACAADSSGGVHTA
jgi:hypothetical protein